MRPNQGAAGLRIALPIAGERRGEFRLDGQRRHRFEPILDGAGKIQPSARKRAFGLGAGAVEPLHGLAAPRRDRHALFGHDPFEGGQPRRVFRAVAQQPRALAQRLFIGRDARAMRRVETEHEPIEKTPPPARTLDKQPVHRRGQPQDAESLAERRLAAHRLAVDSHDPPLPRCRVVPSADAQAAAAGRDDRSDGPAAGRAILPWPRLTIDFGQLGPAQSAAGREKRHSLQEVGLAGTVGSGQHHRRSADGKPRLAIIAEISQHEPRHTDAIYRGTGIVPGLLCLGKHRRYMGSKAPVCEHSAPLASYRPAPSERQLKPALASARKGRSRRRCRARGSASRHPTARIARPRPGFGRRCPTGIGN